MTIKKIHTFWEDTAKVWLHEHLEMFRDEGALLFVILLPLAYPLLYSWIYNNEVCARCPWLLSTAPTLPQVASSCAT